MSEIAVDIKLLLASCLQLAYSEETAEQTVLLYQKSAKDMRVYIVGCVILTLTASVLPRYTLLADRLETFAVRAATSEMKATAVEAGSSSSNGCSDALARRLAEAGFFCQNGNSCSDGSSCDSGYGSYSSSGSSGGTGSRLLVCFHCCLRLDLRIGDDPLAVHRAGSPSCYFARLAELARTRGVAADGLTVHTDARRYEKALRKLSGDLRLGGGLSLAADFGFDPRALAVWATRRFMRSNGACPTRAGDLVALAHESEHLFAEPLLGALDVLRLLDFLDLQNRVAQ